MACKCEACQSGRSIKICFIEGCQTTARNAGSVCQDHWDNGFEYKEWSN